MSLVLTINAVEQSYLQGSLRIQESVHGRGVADLVVQSPDGTYRPVRNQELIVTLDGTRLFGGLINTINEAGVGGEPLVAIDNFVNCVSFDIYADFRHVINGGFPAGTTLLQALTSTVAHLTSYGVSLSGGQVTGPALPLLLYDVRSITSIHEELAQLTGFVIAIDYNKVLSGVVPGTVAAPFNISDSNEHALGDITIEPAVLDQATDAIGRFGSGAREVIDNFTGNGTTAAYTINYFPLIAHRGIVNVGGTVVSGVIVGGVNETLSISGGGTWDYDPATGVVTRTSAVPNGTQVYFQYTAQFPVTITATTGGSPIRQVVILYPDIFDRAAAVQALAADLARLSATSRRVRYRTYTTGLRPGMSQTIQTSKRNFNQTCYIEELSTIHLEGERFLYEVVAVEGTLLQKYWGDIYKEWSEVGGGGGTNVSGGVVVPPISGSVPDPPDLSVQINESGQFSGDAAFTYNPATNSVVCGDASSIDTADAESCQVFGYDCHISS